MIHFVWKNFNALTITITSFWINENFSKKALNIVFAGQSQDERLVTERMCIKILNNTEVTINEIHFDSNFNKSKRSKGKGNGSIDIKKMMAIMIIMTLT